MMELQEMVSALESEKAQYISMIDNINAEKIALDQLLVDSLKNSLSSRKDLILQNAKINELEIKLSKLMEVNEKLQSSISILQSDANCGG